MRAPIRSRPCSIASSGSSALPPVARIRRAPASSWRRKASATAAASSGTWATSTTSEPNQAILSHSRATTRSRSRSLRASPMTTPGRVARLERRAVQLAGPARALARPLQVVRADDEPLAQGGAAADLHVVRQDAPERVGGGEVAGVEGQGLHRAYPPPCSYCKRWG